MFSMDVIDFDKHEAAGSQQLWSDEGVWFGVNVGLESPAGD